MRLGKSRTGQVRLMFTPAEALRLGEWIRVSKMDGCFLAVKSVTAGHSLAQKVLVDSSDQYYVNVAKSLSHDWPIFATQEVKYHESASSKDLFLIEAPDFKLLPIVKSKRVPGTNGDAGNWTDQLSAAIATINTLATKHKGEVQLFIHAGTLRAKIQTTITI